MGKIISQENKNKKVVILKNDRGGDLLVSLKSMFTLINKEKNLTIFLSEVNFGLSFLFKEADIKRINFNLTIIDKIGLFFYFLNNKIEEAYILAPKNYFFYLPLFFRKTKFYAIVIDGKKRNRPPLFLRKYLYKFQIINRDNKVNKSTSEEKQLMLVGNSKNLSNNLFSKIYFKKDTKSIDDLIPKNFYFFQFKEKFFNKIDWDLNKLDNFFNLLLTKCDYVLFSADLNNNVCNNNFIEKYPYIDFNNKNTKVISNKKSKVLYLHDIDAESLFYIIKSSKKVICPHGLVSHIAKICNISTLALFNFNIKNKNDYFHEKVSFSEWYGRKSFDFSFLNKDFSKSIRKISTRI